MDAKKAFGGMDALCVRGYGPGSIAKWMEMCRLGNVHPCRHIRAALLSNEQQEQMHVLWFLFCSKLWVSFLKIKYTIQHIFKKYHKTPYF